MSKDKFRIDANLVRTLIAAQFPQWAGLPVRRVVHDGWDNTTYHLGEAMKVRVPSAERYVAQVEKESFWLPRLAPHLPAPIPVPIALGKPSGIFPWPWSVYGWIEGQMASAERISDLTAFAAGLADFLLALQHVGTTGGPVTGAHNFHRGGSLSVYDAETRDCIALFGSRVDSAGALATWEAALAAKWQGPPVWVHGDFAVSNLLVRDGQLGAVIDFGSSGVGDPACDLVIAWVFLEGTAREAFRAALPYDEGMWARARGWALWKALLIMARNLRTDPAERPPGLVIEAVIGEHQRRPGAGTKRGR